MPRKAILHEQEYEVGAGPVRLTVLVGDRQYGSSMVFLADELLSNGDVDGLPLGRGTELAGKAVVIYTVVTDIRDKKSEMSVTWILDGGAKRVTVEKSGTTAKGFGSQMFKAVFEFVDAD